MKSASRVVVGVVAALSFTVAGAEEPALSSVEARHVIALADGPGLSASLPTGESVLDAYAGRYDAADGAAFFVYREGDSLTIEFGNMPMRLHDAETHNAFTGEGAVRVVFESDTSGRILGLLLYASSDVSIVANRAPLPRGIVTIHDLSDADVSSTSFDGLVRSL